MTTEQKFNPTPEVLQALQLFASLHGRGWKEELRNCWASGWARSKHGYRGEYVGPLQAMRNTGGGHAYLESYRLPKS